MCTIGSKDYICYNPGNTAGPVNPSSFSVKRLNCLQRLARFIFGCYKETHAKTIVKACRDDSSFYFRKLVSDKSLISRCNTLLQRCGILSKAPAKIDFSKGAGVQVLAKPTKTNTAASDVFSGDKAPYHPGPNSGVDGRGKMFGDSYQDGKWVELDPEKVRVKDNGNKDGQTGVADYTLDGKTWHIATAAGLGQPLPSRTIQFNKGDRASYEGTYKLSPNGLPIYPYAHLKFPAKPEQNPQNPQLQLGKLGPNHAGDAEVFRFSDQGLQLAIIFRKKEEQWALPGGMRDHGEKNLAAAKREFREEAAGDDAKGRLAYLDDDSHWVDTIWHGPVASDFRNTLHGWMETSVNALVLPASEAGKWETLKAGDDAANAQWLTIDSSAIIHWSLRLNKLFASHTEFVMLTLLNPKFQQRAIEEAKSDPDQLIELLRTFETAQKEADKFGIYGFDGKKPQPAKAQTSKAQTSKAQPNNNNNNLI